MSITLDELHEFLMFEADDFALELIESAVNYRRKQLGIVKPNVAPVNNSSTSGFSVGDTVVFNSKARPRYLYQQRLTGTVTKVNAKSVLVETPKDIRYRRFSGRVVRTPIDIVDKVS